MTSEPYDASASPFLRDELFTRESAPELEGRVSALEARSPFSALLTWPEPEAGASDDESEERFGDPVDESVAFEREDPHARPDLGVTGRQVHEVVFAFRGKSGERYKKLIEAAAKDVGLDPGLVAANAIAEARRSVYLSPGKTSSYDVGTDDFYEKRHSIAKLVPAYKKINWDEKQTPSVHPNDAAKPRNVKTILFDTGPDALLASAVYLKHCEGILKDEAKKHKGDLDKLPVEVRFALLRLAFNAGLGRAKRNLRELLVDGKDVLIRKQQAKAGPQRRATIHTARALYLSQHVFGQPAYELFDPEKEEEDTETYSGDELDLDELFEVDAMQVDEDRDHLFEELTLDLDEDESSPFTMDQKGDDELEWPIEGEEGDEAESPFVADEDEAEDADAELFFNELDEQLGAAFEEFAPGQTQVVFPSGEALTVLTGLPEAKEQDYWDPTGSGVPLLDTGPVQKTKKLSASFTVRELTTTAGKSADVARIDPALVISIQALRDYVNKGITITSGYRSWASNKLAYERLKKEPTDSQHCAGRAVDLKIAGMNGLEIAKAALTACGPNIGLGIGKRFAHIDVRGYAAAWDYSKKRDPIPPAWVKEVKQIQARSGGRKNPKTGAKATSSNPLVLFAQRVLNAAEGARLKVDGNLGPRTKGAIQRFKSTYGLGSNDKLDDATAIALVQKALETIARQSLFARLGTRDAATEQAVNRFRADNGLQHGGVFDQSTIAALSKALPR